MKIDKNYDPKAHFLEIQKRIQAELGEPVSPSFDKVLEEWKCRVNYRPPRSFLFLVDLKEHRAIRTAGMSVLGYKDDWLFSGQEFIDLVHENQKRILFYQTVKLYEIFLEYPELIQNKGAVYCTSRGIKDVKGKYQLAHQTAIPMQYDANGVIATYLSYYNILGEYRGEALETNIFNAPQFKKEQEKMMDLIEKVKLSLFSALGFSPIQREIIKLMAIEPKIPSAEEIISILELSSVRALEAHRYRIMSHAKKIFPLNKFKTTKDVIAYLRLQRII